MAAVSSRCRPIQEDGRLRAVRVWRDRVPHRATVRSARCRATLKARRARSRGCSRRSTPSSRTSSNLATIDLLLRERGLGEGAPAGRAWRCCSVGCASLSARLRRPRNTSRIDSRLADLLMVIGAEEPAPHRHRQGLPGARCLSAAVSKRGRHSARRWRIRWQCSRRTLQPPRGLGVRATHRMLPLSYGGTGAERRRGANRETEDAGGRAVQRQRSRRFRRISSPRLNGWTATTHRSRWTRQQRRALLVERFAAVGEGA